MSPAIPAWEAEAVEPEPLDSSRDEGLHAVGTLTAPERVAGAGGFAVRELCEDGVGNLFREGARDPSSCFQSHTRRW